MVKRRRKPPKSRKDFEPMQLATKVAQAVYRDLSDPLHEYRVGGRTLKLAIEMQRTGLLKKFVEPGAKQDHLVDATLEKFLGVNLHMTNFRSFSFPEPSLRPQRHRTDRDNILLRARAMMYFVLSPFSEEEWFLSCKHGSGTSIGVSYRDTSLEAKSTFPISMTSRVVALMDRYLEFDNSLNSALLSFNSVTPIGDKYQVVRGSRATTVEKNDTIRRGIAVEPTGNMFFQQGLMAMMYTRMRKVGLSLASLPRRHQKMAKESSITSRYATIDWSSASDCLSIELLRWLVPPKWFEVCEQVRSPFISVRGEWVELNMFATMGNAVTFPLETLVFWCLGQAVIAHRSGSLSLYPEWVDQRECSVFGDDCILPTEYAEEYINVCSEFGFMVNKEKSFYDHGGFRESCGGDFLHGEPVRPFCMKGPISAAKSALEPWLYYVINSLLPKYMQYFGERDYLYDKELFKLFSKLCRTYDLSIKIVPTDFPLDAGLVCLEEDYARFILNYPGNYSRITSDVHGTLEFHYCRFQYWNKRKHNSDLRYADAMRGRVTKEFERVPNVTDLPNTRRKRVPWTPTREKGGYVVAKGRSAHWALDRDRI